MNKNIDASTIEQILDLARWAPSGDNMQTWRFEIAGPAHLAVHAYDTRDHCVYDLDGHPSQIAFGTLLETIAIAASGHGLRADIVRRPEGRDTHPVFDVRFAHDPAIARDPLIDVINVRTVQRRPMKTTPLTPEHKRVLEAAVGPGYALTWLESRSEKWQAAKLMFNNARLRLTMPEAFETHRSIIDWNNPTHSPDKVPTGALGIDAMTLQLMKWAMVSWRRMSTVNTLMGTWAPRLQMDLAPGMACAAHFVLKARTAPRSIDDYVAAGRALQRFWLTMTTLGLYMQPEMTPLIFSKYAREQTRFTATPKLNEAAQALRRETEALIFTDALAPVYMGRLGYGPAPQARSLRRPLAELMKS
ncbi:nitroreductase family protein [Massilia sp. Leaf139]|uniref:nitroreductase family protein n=1 Tax=Massilia sp. Leaf139 TaxID=1736272 RepID=UPI0006F43A8B|nr:nitroreductase family protein [Massilia sp. Leaf139]KQQ87058.1 molybdopterin biosynthesis protein MoeY [Massilia sp. Leaf139]